MLIFQLLFFFFFLFAIWSVVSRKRSGLLSTKGAAFWVLFWVGALIVVFAPRAITLFANHLGIGRGADFVMYISIACVFFVLFRLHVKLHEIEQTITTVVRQEALDTIKKETSTISK